VQKFQAWGDLLPTKGGDTARERELMAEKAERGHRRGARQSRRRWRIDAVKIRIHRTTTRPTTSLHRVRACWQASPNAPRAPSNGGDVFPTHGRTGSGFPSPPHTTHDLSLEARMHKEDNRMAPGSWPRK
jgi:hypothetical protein